jgi:hypothetical protein
MNNRPYPEQAPTEERNHPMHTPAVGNLPRKRSAADAELVEALRWIAEDWSGHSSIPARERAKAAIAKASAKPEL